MDFPNHKSAGVAFQTRKTPVVLFARCRPRADFSWRHVSKNHGNNKRRTLTGRRAWLAAGTIAAYAAAGTSKAALAFAQNGSSQKTQPGSQAQLPVRRFDIPAGPLDTTLAQFAKICGVTVNYSIPTETVSGFKSPGVSGLYSQEQALRQILTGTGLSFTYSGQDQIVIGVRNAESVEVRSAVPDSIALAKFPAPLLDTPQSITAIPQAGSRSTGRDDAARCASQCAGHQPRGR